MKIYSLTIRILMAPFKLLLSAILVIFAGFPLILILCFLSAICEKEKADKVDDILCNVIEKQIPSIFKFGCPYKE